jgi:hypothetical protein
LVTAEISIAAVASIGGLWVIGPTTAIRRHTPVTVVEARAQGRSFAPSSVPAAGHPPKITVPEDPRPARREFVVAQVLDPRRAAIARAQPLELAL